MAVHDWTGPREGDLEPGTGDVLRAPVPPERWPYAHADEHDTYCNLHSGGLFCDCDASVNDEDS